MFLEAEPQTSQHSADRIGMVHSSEGGASDVPRHDPEEVTSLSLKRLKELIAPLQSPTPLASPEPKPAAASRLTEEMLRTDRGVLLSAPLSMDERRVSKHTPGLGSGLGVRANPNPNPNTNPNPNPYPNPNRSTRLRPRRRPTSRCSAGPARVRARVRAMAWVRAVAGPRTIGLGLGLGLGSGSGSGACTRISGAKYSSVPNGEPPGKVCSGLHVEGGAALQLAAAV